MNKTFKLASTAIIGLIVISITVAVFFLVTATPRESLDWWALSFVLLSELLVFGGLIYLTMSASVSGGHIILTGILSSLSIYWGISVALAVLRNMFADHQNTYIVVNIILIGFVLIISVMLNMTALKVQCAESKTNNSRLFLQDIENRLYLLQSNNSYLEVMQGLFSLYEKVKFSDKIGISSHDKALSDEIDKLEVTLDDMADGKKEKVESSISQIMFFLKQRNMELSQSKKGGI